MATTYQAVSGGPGNKAIAELEEQIPLLAVLAGELADDPPPVYPHYPKPIAFNVIPLLGTPDDAGYTDEEMKMQNESRKILEIPDLAVSPTCVRVPVVVGHAIQVRATFEREPSVDGALEAMGAHEGVELDPVPTPLEWAGRDEVVVGRVRKDLADPHALNLFVVGDNLLKGAALNTVQIAEKLVERGLLR